MNRTKDRKGTYVSLLKGSLRKFVEQQLDKPPETQLELYEELALLRHRASDVVEKYSVAVESGDEKSKYMVAALMKEELEGISKMATAASRIQAATTEQMTMQAMELIIGTIIDIIFQSLDSEPNGLQIASKIEKRIRNEINITVDKGTTSLPSDEVVKLMDATVPSGPED